MNIPNVEKLKEVIEKLKSIMGIQDWEIEIELISGLEMANRNDGDLYVEGLAYRDIRRNRATISINKEICEDWYSTLVHEMLHIQSTMLIYTAESYMGQTHSYFTDIYEAYNDRLTRMFVNLYPASNLNIEEAI